MGWGYCGTMHALVQDVHAPDGEFVERHIGYMVPAECDQRGCHAKINRGLGNVCGEMHHGPWDDAPGCGRYYCDSHGGGLTRGCRHTGKFAWGKSLACEKVVERDGEKIVCLWPIGHDGECAREETYV